MARDAQEAPTRARRLWAAALFAWICVIWGHSLMAGPQSSAESGFFVDLFKPLFFAAGVTDLDLIGFAVRKTAHFSEYAILGFLVANNIRVRWQDRLRAVAEGGGLVWVRIALIHAAFLVVPVIDECIQLTTEGRSGNPVDVLIDCAGFVTGSLVTWLFLRLRRR